MALNEEKHRRMELRKKTGTRVIKPPATPSYHQGAVYALAYACLNCRTSNKRHFEVEYPSTIQCPICNGKAINLGRNFRAPRKSDIRQWKKIEFLVEHGFFFQKVRSTANGIDSVPYPKTLAEAKEFVVKYEKYSRKTRIT